MDFDFTYLHFQLWQEAEEKGDVINAVKLKEAYTTL